LKILGKVHIKSRFTALRKSLRPLHLINELKVRRADAHNYAAWFCAGGKDSALVLYCTFVEITRKQGTQPVTNLWTVCQGISVEDFLVVLLENTMSVVLLQLEMFGLKL